MVPCSVFSQEHSGYLGPPRWNLAECSKISIASPIWSTNKPSRKVARIQNLFRGSCHIPPCECTPRLERIGGQAGVGLTDADQLHWDQVGRGPFVCSACSQWRRNRELSVSPLQSFAATISLHAGSPKQRGLYVQLPFLKVLFEHS